MISLAFVFSFVERSAHPARHIFQELCCVGAHQVSAAAAPAAPPRAMIEICGSPRGTQGGSSRLRSKRRAHPVRLRRDRPDGGRSRPRPRRCRSGETRQGGASTAESGRAPLQFRSARHGGCATSEFNLLGARREKDAGHRAECLDQSPRVVACEAVNRNRAPRADHPARRCVRDHGAEVRVVVSAGDPVNQGCARPGRQHRAHARRRRRGLDQDAALSVKLLKRRHSLDTPMPGEHGLSGSAHDARRSPGGSTGPGRPAGGGRGHFAEEARAFPALPPTRSLSEPAAPPGCRRL